jgi:voltage-gated potassium channel
MPLPSYLARVIGLLLGREGRSLHSKAAAGATLVLAAVMLLGSWAVTEVERGASGANLTSYPRALWWSVETATTVGYGDFYPVTFWGRVIACVVMFMGITTYGMITAAIATWFVGRDARRQHHLVQRLSMDARALHERFDRLEHLLRPAGRAPGDPG